MNFKNIFTDLLLKLKEYLFPIVFACVHFLLTIIFRIDKVFFNYPDVNYGHLVVVKIIYFILLISAYCFGYFVFKKIKEGNPLYKRGFNIFCIYFAIMFILILLTWPGLWGWDDVWVLMRDVWANYTAWQHILSSISHMLFVQVLPFVGGIIIVQNLIISICVAYSIVKLENIFNLYLKNKYLDVFVKILPFLALPVLRYQLSGYRMGLYVYLELAMLIMLLSAFKEDKKWNWVQSLIFIIISVLSITWRSESFIYLPFVCGLLFFAKNIGNNIKRSIIVLLIIISTILINSEQKHYLRNSNYKIMSTLLQGVELIRHADKEKDMEELKIIDKVVKLDVVYKYPHLNGERLYWDCNVVRNDYHKKDYKAYIKALIKLSLKYPRVVANERMSVFIDTSGIRGRSNSWTYNIIVSIFSNNKELNAVSPFFMELSNKFKLNKPINLKLRKETARIITVYKNKFLYRIFWNLIPSLLAILGFWVVSLYKKSWPEFILSLSMVGKFIIIFLSAPSNWSMYYLSFFLIGYVIIFFAIINFIKKKGLKNNG